MPEAIVGKYRFHSHHGPIHSYTPPLSKIGASVL